jgi:hypothetical protein
MQEAAKEAFENCTPVQRKEAYLMMTVLLSSRAAKSLITDEKKRHIPTIDELATLLGKCSYADKLFMVGRIISWYADDAMRLYKSEPKQIDTLSTVTLRALAKDAQEEAHQKLVKSFPPAAGLLGALECLTDFSITADAPTANDIKDVKESLQTVWGWEDKTEKKSARVSLVRTA